MQLDVLSNSTDNRCEGKYYCTCHLREIEHEITTMYFLFLSVHADIFHILRRKH